MPHTSIPGRISRLVTLAQRHGVAMGVRHGPRPADVSLDGVEPAPRCASSSRPRCAPASSAARDAAADEPVVVTDGQHVRPRDEALPCLEGAEVVVHRGSLRAVPGAPQSIASAVDDERLSRVGGRSTGPASQDGQRLARGVHPDETGTPLLLQRQGCARLPGHPGNQAGPDGQRKTTVLWPLSSTRDSACQRTARESTWLSTSRPAAASAAAS